MQTQTRFVGGFLYCKLGEVVGGKLAGGRGDVRRKGWVGNLGQLAGWQIELAGSR